MCVACECVRVRLERAMRRVKSEREKEMSGSRGGDFSRCEHEDRFLALRSREQRGRNNDRRTTRSAPVAEERATQAVEAASRDSGDLRRPADPVLLATISGRKSTLARSPMYCTLIT